MSKITLFGNTEIQEGWKWRESSGKMSLPKDMETRHLFHTLKMIWNHTMPEDARFTIYKKYTFSDRYSPEYMMKAVFNIGNELFKRTDLTDLQKLALSQMNDYLMSKTRKIPYANII